MRLVKKNWRVVERLRAVDGAEKTEEEICRSEWRRKKMHLAVGELDHVKGEGRDDGLGD